MSIHCLQQTQVVPRSQEECWAFFSDPRNLARLTPPSLDFKVQSDLPPAIYAGMMIRYRLRPLLGFPVTWLTEITQIERPRYFADEQRIGPYQLWHHEHFFEPRPDGGVEMRDCVHYALPLGLAGEIVHALLVEKEIRKIFAFRRQAVAEIFATGSPA